ncbi:MAG: type I secretion system permease/ATPase [Pigmentiphaga sp.]|uniref:type I secretion system permease/ATPase n=1 Tax=Pigmentiphaga sp. TaxID=1977564 RepID=UPI0029BD525F|nr:type I secretion system permease/ATPase [Pigmentiphaga sp.]MDX3906513.1 type I secretion system permease/ATPase [Pigmentiphaga sp.]
MTTNTMAAEDHPASGDRASMADTGARDRAWIEAVQAIARHYGLPCSPESLHIARRWADGSDEDEALRDLARRAGLGLTLLRGKGALAEISNWRLPVAVQLADGQVGVLEAFGADGLASIAYCGDDGQLTRVSARQLLDQAVLVAVMRPVGDVPDARVDAYISPYRPHWLRRIVLRDLRPYWHIMLGSLVANILTLTGVLFSMQVYDRVIPAGSLPTLYVLFIGVLIALLFDFILRRVRTTVTDLLGKRADMRISDRVFGHALRVRSTARPASTGTFISQLRDLESIREMMTSTTVTALADVPFFLLFLVVFWYLVGPLVAVPLAATVLLLVPGLLVQRRLRRYAQTAMRESSLRNAMLVESVQGSEDIKTMQAEDRFQSQWNHYNAVTAEAQLRTRSLTNTLIVWTQTVQTGVYATVIFFGAPRVMDGEMTTGVLVAASLLSSRMMGPMARMTQVLGRWQQARIGVKSVDQIMQLPVDQPEHEQRIHRPAIQGAFQFDMAAFRYTPDSPVTLQIKNLRIQPRERIAVLGRNGAGKSTLLQALSGLLEPAAGELLLDGVRLAHIDPADVRRDIGILTQNARLFHGTLRDNLLLGAPRTSDERILQALEWTGALNYLRRLPKGLDHMVQEGGLGLSGGQRQSLLLARLLLRDPKVLLLDEPTASMDETTEKRFIRYLAGLEPGRSLVVATHRTSLLSAVQRVIVVENGMIALDGEKDEVIAELTRRSKVRLKAAV